MYTPYLRKDNIRIYNRAWNNIYIERIQKYSLLNTQNFDTTVPEDTVAYRLKRLRLEKNLTIRNLAKLTGLVPETISRIENGASFPDLNTFKKLATVLQISIAYLGCFDLLPEETLGQKIKKVRFSLGLTKKEFAKMIGVHEKTVRWWERDKQIPSEKYQKLLEALQNKLS